MALLSKVTVVVSPSPQLDTPAPMTGDPLDVFEPNEYLDPPALVNNNCTVWLSVLNPQQHLPAPEVNDTTPPPSIFRNNFHQYPREPNARRSIRNVYLPAIASVAHSLVFQGAERINDLQLPDTVQSFAPNVLNGRDADIATFLTYDHASAPSTWFSMANSTAENEMQAEGPTMGDPKIAHSWVMCGKAYVMMTTGEIYRSVDAFTAEVEQHGTVYENTNPPILIKRNHPGVLIEEFEPY